jgi:HSP20 family protein
MPRVIRRSETVTAVRGRGREVRRPLGWQVTTGVWSPPTDVFETPDEFVVSVELAGMSDKDFEVVFDEGILSITGRRPDRTERRAYHQMEIHFGDFSSAVRMPGAVDVDHSRAEYANGFLIVRMPKVKPTDVKVTQ